jgi:vitamin B12 transporter
MPLFLADPAPIVVTASRIPAPVAQSAATVTLVDPARLERLGPPLIADLLRLAPSAAVSTSGPAGSLTQVRIRGAEANHTLLFIDGIRANDPAAANEPRFELVNADLASRVEIVRGPQSALWGSEAIGGVVAVDGPLPGSGGRSAMVEAGSFGSRRGAARFGLGDADAGLSLGIAGQGAEGIDSFSGRGDHDGYSNRAMRGSGRVTLAPGVVLGVSGFAFRGRSDYDGYDPVTYLHADTADQTRNRLHAARLFGQAGDRGTAYALLSASLLGSANRNALDGAEINRTAARRRTLGAEGGITLGHHHFVVALESEAERFHARDSGYYGQTDQDRGRAHRSLTAAWRGEFGALTTDLSLRRDIFSRFADASSLRGSLLARLGHGFQLAATYGEGIAQPSFFDLYGFFPAYFTGNPALRPERSKGGEVALRYRGTRLDAALTVYRQRLDDEIVDVFNSAGSTTANAVTASRRRGFEAEAGVTLSPAARISAHYANLDAEEPSVASGQLKEQRRPRHSGHLALDGAAGRFSYGTALAFVGSRIDTDFDVFPARRVRLDPYFLASGRLAYRVSAALEGHIRVGNALGARYQDVLGYRTEGRSIHAGLRLVLGD